MVFRADEDAIKIQTKKILLFVRGFGLDFYCIFISTKNHSTRGGQRLKLFKIKVIARQKGTRNPLMSVRSGRC